MFGAYKLKKQNESNNHYNNKIKISKSSIACNTSIYKLFCHEMFKKLIFATY